MKRPTVKPAPGDRLVRNKTACLAECTFTDGRGFLLELRESPGPNGPVFHAVIFRADAGINVSVSAEPGPPLVTTTTR